MNCLVAGLLFRPLEPPRKKAAKPEETKLLLKVNSEYRPDDTEIGQVRVRVVHDRTGQRSKLGFYVPFNSQGHIGTGPQNCHLWDSNPQR